MLRIQILGAFGSTEVCVQGLLNFCCMLTPCRRWTTQMTERSLKHLNAQNRSNSGPCLLRYVILRELTIEWKRLSQLSVWPHITYPSCTSKLYKDFTAYRPRRTPCASILDAVAEAQGWYKRRFHRVQGIFFFVIMSYSSC